MFYLQIYGSKFEAKNFIYRIKIEDPEFGEFCYKGYVKSLDDKKMVAYESQIGLIVPSKVLKKFIDDDLTVEIEIEDLKETLRDEATENDAVTKLETDQKLLLDFDDENFE